MALIKKIPLFPCLIALIGFLVFLTNVTPHTYLIGWDNIMPEFNFGLNFQRTLTGAWLGYRGLGVPLSLSEIAGLVHVAFLFLLSLALPQWLLRYAFIHFTHILGGIGMYYLSLYIIKNKKAAFLSALFYMLNLGVIQMYFAPLETFATHFAALPLLSLFILKTLQNPSKKNYLFLFLISFLMTPQAYVPTLFIVFLILFIFILAFHIIQTKSFKTALLVFITVLCANAFWLLPYTITAAHDSQVIAQTRINQFSSEEIFYRNQARGTLLDVMELKGFMLDTVEYDQVRNINVNFMQSWRTLTGNIFVQIAELLLFAISVFGMFIAVRNKNRITYPFLTAAVLCFILLANNTPVFEQISVAIRTIFPTVGEIFRFPFTKFMTLFAFCLSLFLGIGLSQIFSVIKRDKISVVVISVIILALAGPAFTGNFTSPLLRNAIPNDYFQTFNYFSQQDPQARVALLPMYTFWNWQYRTWGQRGSGFLWYGIPQAITERAFDPWSLTNEQFYNELSYAISTQDQNLVETELRKYNIQYFLEDQYLLTTLTTQPINYDSLNKFLSSDTHLHLEKTYGRIKIYKTDIPVSTISQASLASIPDTTTPIHFARQDSLNELTPNYITDNSASKPDIIQFFPSLATEKLPSDNTFSVSQTPTQFILQPKTLFSGNSSGYTLVLPSIFKEEFLIPVKLSTQNSSLIFTPVYPRVFINNQEITNPQTPIIISGISITNPTTITFNDIKQQINLGHGQSQSYLLNNYSNTITISNDKQSQTLIIDLHNYASSPLQYRITDHQIQSVKIIIDKFESPLSISNMIQKLHSQKSSTPVMSAKGDITLSVKSGEKDITMYQASLYHQASYILSVSSSYQSGLPINFYLDNPPEQRPEIETRLTKSTSTDTIIIPKSEDYFQGYGFHFIEKSVGTETGTTTLNKISLYPIPLETIQGIHLEKTPANMARIANNSLVNVPSTGISPFYYHLTTTSTANTLIVLNQAYNADWFAFSLSPNNKLSILKDHVLVNNWSNGWVLPTQASNLKPQTSIIILFWPQVLEYLGMVLAAIYLLIISIYKRK